MTSHTVVCTRIWVYAYMYNSFHKNGQGAAPDPARTTDGESVPQVDPPLASALGCLVRGYPHGPLRRYGMNLKRAILEAMGRDALKDAVVRFDLADGVDRRSSDAMRSRLARARRSTPEALLPRLRVADVRRVCESQGVDATARRQVLVERLLDGDAKPRSRKPPSASKDPHATGREPRAADDGTPEPSSKTRKRQPESSTAGNNGATTGYETELWAAANALRGNMDAAEYKHVVLGLIFLKYVSDAEVFRVPMHKCLRNNRVDDEHQLIVATELTSNANDQGAMVGLLDEVEETFDAQPETVLADAGYCNERDLSELETRGIDGYVAPGREGKEAVNKDVKTHPATHRMVEKLATPTGRERYAQREWLSEAPNGWVKEVLGFRRFSVRGLDKARGEWDLVCLALNVKRLQPLLAV